MVEPPLLWTFTVPANEPTAFTSPTIAPDGTIVIMSDDSALYALLPDGTTAWSVPPVLPGGGAFMPAIGRDGTIYTIGPNRSVAALTPAGATKWTFGSYTSAPSVRDDGTILPTVPTPDASTDVNDLSVISPDGIQVWSVSVGYAWAFEPITAADGTVYLDTGAGLAAVGASGAPKWVIPLMASGGQSPVTDSAGTIYVGTYLCPSYPTGSGLRAVRSDGTQAWVFHPEATFLSPSIGADGTLYAPAAWNTGSPAVPVIASGLYAIGR